MSRKPCLALSRRSCVAALFLALAVAAPALAAPIDYIFTGVLTASFYGGAPGDQSVTIIATGDVAAVTAASTCNNLGSVRVVIPGKSATVTEPLAIFVDRAARNLGLRRGTCAAPLSPWLVVNNAVVFGGYSLAASLVPGPVVPTALGLGSVSTTLGTLNVVANVLSSFEAQGPNPPPSSNAKLSGLVLSSGVLTPAVNGNTFQYTGRVADSVASVTLTPTAADPAASILVNGAAVASGSASAPIALAPGENRVTIAVTAPDGFATQNYVVNVIRLDPNYQGLWWKSPPGSESGWGINFAHQGDVIFATWFTYRDDGKPWWLIAELHKVGNGRYTGSIATVAGPAFNSVPFEPGLVHEALVGTMTVTFTGPADGVLETNVEGFAQTKPITRQVFGPLPVCTWGTQADLAPATNYQDLWWKASESGWGINFTHQGDVIFATWFTYDVVGKPWWLTAELHKAAAGVYAGTVTTLTGPPFDSNPFQPGKVVETAVGSATVSFANGNSASFAYTVNGIAQTKAIARQVFAPPGTVCQ